MQVITTVTQKGQVTLPKQLREAAGISLYGKVFVEADAGQITIKPGTDIFDLAGTFKPKKNKNKSVLQARSYMEKHYKRF
jgi:AbrB family looped-hinge helix DNA binding protein